MSAQSEKDWCARGTEAISARAYDRAVACFDAAIRLNPKSAYAFDNRAYAYELQGQYQKAIADYTEAIRVNETYHYSYNNLAWLKATCPEATFRNGREAVELAKKACELTGWNSAEDLATLAASYAEAGNFPGALEWQTKAIANAKDTALRDRLKERLLLYSAGLPYHAPPR